MELYDISEENILIFHRDNIQDIKIIRKDTELEEKKIK